MGRLIPAGTGWSTTGNVDVERDETIDQRGVRERELDEFPDIVGRHEIASATESAASYCGPRRRSEVRNSYTPGCFRGSRSQHIENKTGEV